MKSKKILMTFLCLLFGSLFIQAHIKNAYGQKTPRTIEFAKLSDYVNDSDKRRDGERVIVDGVPPFERLTYEKRRNIYSFMPDESGDVGNTFFTSSALAKSLRQHLKLGDYLSVLVYCTLVQFVGDQDVYRSPFVTKVEGFDGHGRLAWSAVGPAPAKLKLPQ